MREIKFRAWDGERLKEVLTLGLNEGFISTPKTVAPIENFKLMQYTGLKDKNGKEIYEGDVLRGYWESHDMELEFIAPVVFHSELSLFGFPVTISGSYKLPLENYNNALANVLLHKTEIIGNIYENPELLS